MRQTRCSTPPSSVYWKSGGVRAAASACFPKDPWRSENIRKMGLKFARVALRSL
jgi:hypothetical protein